VKQQSMLGPVLAALALHAALAAVLIWNTDFNSPPKPAPGLGVKIPSTLAVKTVTVDPKKVAALVRRIKKHKAAQAAKQRRLQRRLVQLERKRKREESRTRKAAKKRLEEERKSRLAERERKRKERQAKKASAEATVEQKRLSEQRARVELEQQKAEQLAARRRKEELQQRQQSELEQQMQQEQQRLATERKAQVLSEVDKYQALIRDKIYSNLIAGVDAVVSIRLAPGGLVIDVSCQKGDRVACRDALVAVRKSEPLPVSADADVFAELRVIKLTLNKIKPGEE